MSRFPFFKEVEGKRALVVGGGEVALRRARALVDFGVRVTCVSPEYCDGFSQLDAYCIRRELELEDMLMHDWDIVIAATDNRSLNAAVAAAAKAHKSEVSVADDPDASTFLFPGIVRRGGMTVAISSGGASPSAVRYVREQIESAIPDHFEDVLESMETARRLAKELIQDQKERARVLRTIFDFCIRSGSRPDAGAIEGMIRRDRGTELD